MPDTDNYDAVINWISGPVLRATTKTPFHINEAVKVGAQQLLGEVIRINGNECVIQVYEDTTGLKPGDPVSATGYPLSVKLGPGLLGNISASMAAFQSAMESIGMDQQVTTFTQSDFGRTLTSNGDGSDHAWGGHQIVMGGNVNGQRIYGDYPVPEIGGTLDVGGGRFIPTTAADQYAATLAKWFGIDDADLDVVAPSLVNFQVRDLGFMIG